MEYENLAIANTREGIMKIINESKLPVMTVNLIIGEVRVIIEREAQIVLDKEYEAYMKAQEEKKFKAQESLQETKVIEPVAK